MLDRRPFGFFTLLPAVLCALACKSADAPRQAPPPGPAPAAADRSRTLPLPEAQSAPQAPAARGDLRWQVPAGWTVERPSSSMRLAQYRVPGDAGPAECVVFYFGGGQGGDPKSNAARWAGQFTQPDGSTSLERMQTTRLATGSVPIHLVEVTGTYDGGMTMTDAPATPKPGYMLLGAIAEGPDAPWFFKMTGPETTVRAQRASFLEMLESIRSGP
jgi:hypothetical protein